MRSILLVDDEKYIRRGIKTILQNGNTPFAEIYEASDGISALTVLEQLKIDVAVVDMKMPHMDGITLIKESQQLKKVPRFIILSGYDEFHYAKTAMKYGVREYLLKPVDIQEMIETLLRVEEEIRKEETLSIKNISIINRMMLNGSLQPDDWIKAFNHDKAAVVSGEFNVCLLRNKKWDALLNCKPAATAAESYFTENRQAAICFDDDGCNTVVICPVHTDYSGLLEFLGARLGEDYIIAVSDNMAHIEDIRLAFSQAGEAMKHRLLVNQPCILSYKGLPHPAKAYDIPVNTLCKVDELLGMGIISEVHAAIDKLFDMVFLKTAGIKYVEALSNAIYSIVISKSIKYVEHDDEILWKANLLMDIYNFSTVYTYVAALKEFLCTVGNCAIALRNENKDRKAINLAARWIHDNYMKDNLSMNTVASHVSLNYSYFSYLFNKYMGMSFVSYLKKVRVNAAKELLVSTNRKIHEISKMVGFINPRLFTKTFREDTGMSPLEFSKKT